MASVATAVPGRVGSVDGRARLLCGTLEPLILPWWPDEVETSGMAAGYAEDPRPGRTPVLTRSADPLATFRMPFTLSGPTLQDSVLAEVTLLERYAAAKPVVQVMFGRFNRGHWRVTEASMVEKAWTSAGEPAEVDVTLTLRRASDAAIPIGPVKKRPSR